MKNNKKIKIHFIGIGGIGISGIASIYKKQGHQVRGSDVEASETTAELKKQGIKIFIGQKKENLRPRPDLVVYSEAVPFSNLELKEAKRLKIKCLSGAQALAELSQDYFTIAVSGMHGKSTTASMIAQILIKAGLDPTFVIGTKPGWRLGRSKYLVIEADDYQAKFLHYHPDILVLTNVEKEHMDYFKNFQHIKKVFSKYVKQVKGFIVANKDDKNTLKILMSNFQFSIFKKKVKLYSLKDKDAVRIKKILKVPGEHNVSNALAALNAVRFLGISDKITLKALSEYKGVWRRFEESCLKIGNRKLKIISDYAHHPTEIQATLQAAKEKFKNRKIWLIFQPHQYQRTFYLFQDFRRVFQKNPLAKLIITDIYTVQGRESEAIKKKIHSQKLVAAIDRKWAIYLPKDEIIGYIKKNFPGKEVLIFMGAGDIYRLIDDF